MCWVTSTFDDSLFIRVGSQPLAPLIVDHRLLAIMRYGPKAEILDEIFGANQGAGEGRFSCAQVFTTTDRCQVYQVESPTGPSKIWLPYDPRFTAGNGDEIKQKVITAVVPRGTVVGVGLVGNETRWYIPGTQQNKMLAKPMPETLRRESPIPFDNATFVRNGSQASGSLVVDRSLLAPMRYAPKRDFLDEIFGANQDAGEEQFSRVQMFTTKDRCFVYQAESPMGLSKIWAPYDLRLAGGIGGEAARKMIRAAIPKGTVVGVGLMGNETRWYIPSTYEDKVRSKQVPAGWRVETLAATSAPPGAPSQPVSA